MSKSNKPSIVFCHGIWADGSCFNKVIPALQAEGHEVMAVQYGLDTFTEDVTAIKRTLGRVSSPAILVGHSYGGATITAAGTDDRVIGLVYIAAVAPDAGETVQGQLNNYPTDVFKNIAVADGRVWLLSRKAPSALRETFPSKSRRSCGRPITRPPPIYLSNKSPSPMTSLGSRNRAGSLWPRMTAPCIPTSSVSWQSVWGRPPSRRTAATSSCSPSLTLSLT
jgi:pimeloyl-ACP methyl ester carboxylesterase